MNFNDLAIKNSIGFSKIGILFKTEDNNIHIKNLRFYLSFIKDNNRIYICALDFNAITSFDLDVIKNQKHNNKKELLLIFQAEIFKRIDELTTEYVCFYKDNFRDAKKMKAFIRKADFSLIKSYNLMVLKSHSKKLKNITYSFKNDNIDEYKDIKNDNIDEYENLKNVLRVSNAAALLL